MITYSTYTVRIGNISCNSQNVGERTFTYITFNGSNNMTKVVTGKITKVSPLEIIVKINQASFKTFNKSKQRLTNKQKP